MSRIGKGISRFAGYSPALSPVSRAAVRLVLTGDSAGARRATPGYFARFRVLFYVVVAAAVSPHVVVLAAIA